MTSIEGFVPLASYDDECRSKQSGHSVRWKILRDAIGAGEIDGLQHGGSKRWYVNKAQADKFLERHARQGGDRPVGEGKTQLECLMNIEETLAAILDLMRAQTLLHINAPQWHPKEECEAAT